MVTPTDMLVEWLFASAMEIVAVPPATAVSVKDVPVALAPESSRRAADDDDAAATVTTAVFDDVAVNEPVYPGSDTSIVVVVPLPLMLIDDTAEPLEVTVNAAAVCAGVYPGARPEQPAATTSAAAAANERNARITVSP